MFAKSFRLRTLISAGVLGLALILSLISVNFIAPTQAETAYSKNNLIRLHILANSNAPVDQDLKLKVRDAVLLAANDIFAGVATKEQARTYIQDNWDYIKETALAAVREQGFDYSVDLQLGTFNFPLREYGDFSLPGGDYEALRIIIGEGRGDNWWCVLFPPLCLVSLSEEYEQQQLIAENQKIAQGNVEFRLKLWEHISDTAYGQRLQEWWQASLHVTNTLALPW